MCIYSSSSMSSSSIGSLSRSSFSVITSTNSCKRSGNNCTPSMYTPWSHMYTIHTITICKNANLQSRTNMHARERARGKDFFSGGISNEADGDELLLKHVCGSPWPRAHSVKPYKRSREPSLSSHLKPRNSQAHCNHIQERKYLNICEYLKKTCASDGVCLVKLNFSPNGYSKTQLYCSFILVLRGYSSVSSLHWSTVYQWCSTVRNKPVLKTQS